jgi:hypothetical protein
MRFSADPVTGGTITHGDGSSVVSAPASPADLDGVSRFGVLPKVPVKLRAHSSGYAHEFAHIGSLIGA